MQHADAVTTPVAQPRRYILRNIFTSHAEALTAGAHIARRRNARVAVFTDASGFWRVRVAEAA